MKKYLALGKMPRDADPDLWLAAGPWCFAGQEDDFPGWEEKYEFAPEPLADSAQAARAARAAQALCVWAIPRIARFLCPESDSYPVLYWETLLSSWAIDVSRQLVERGLRCEAMVEKWGGLELSVPILPADCHFIFATEHDFTLRGNLGEEYNHWLFSRILEDMWPQCWEKALLPPVKWPVAQAGRGLGQKARNRARRLLLNLPFPRLKGMGWKQALLYSSALVHPRQGADKSLNLAAEFGNDELLKSMPLPGDVIKFFIMALPASIRTLEHPAELRNLSAMKSGKREPRLRVASVAAYEDTLYRQKLAIWRGRGNSIACVQHGGNYGQVRTACEACITEYSQDIFFTWGWSDYQGVKGNFIPMPYPQLAKTADAWHGDRNGGIVFVGTEMAAYGYRLDSHPTPLQFVAYRHDKEIFLNALGAELRANLFYRPYFSLPGTLADASWLVPRFPGIRLCEGSLLPAILNCGLLVLDHHGTTMLEAMAANVPLVMFWNPDHWLLTRDCDNLLAVLEKAGIWHPDPESAAARILEVWDDVPKWWNRFEARKARNMFCEKYARIPAGNIDAAWINTLKKL